jgi:hypothetical protein
MNKIMLFACLLLLFQGFARAEAPATQPALSSKPAEKDGLQVMLTLPKAAFSADEPLKFEVEFKNVSKNPFTLYNAKWYWNWQTRFVQVQTGSWQLHETFIGMRGPIPTVDALQPGEALHVPVVVDPSKKLFEYVWQGEQDKPVPSIRQLKPGKYRMTVEITLGKNTSGDEAVHPYWTGTIKTEPVEFEITDKPAVPATQP